MTTDSLATRLQGKSFDAPDNVTRAFGELGQAEIIQLGDTTAVRATFQPGFHWVEHVKPIVGTDLCQARHVGYVVSGRARIRLGDGSEGEVKAGDVFHIPPGHDMWTVGDEAYVAVDFTAGQQLAAAPRPAPTTPPDHHRVLLDNDDVRVLEVRIPPRGTSGRHSHPKSVVYQLTETRVRMSIPDGTSRELELKPGQVTWTPGGEHTVDNLGPNDDWGIIVELKR
jgi:quercetin dioxygenase-like cupin family protein